MSKLTQSIYATISDFGSQAEDMRIAYQFTQNQYIDGRGIKINDAEMLNFSSCSYLGLETDYRIKEAIADYVIRYGSQFSMTRAFLSITPYLEAEELLEKLFGAHVLITSSTSMGHQSVLPVVVGDEDMVIMDQRVHASVQLAANPLKLRGVQVEIIRHSQLNGLEDMIKNNQRKNRKIFYCIDGIYSMYGDYAPYDELKQLMSKYENLHLYIDDAHGMSWTGRCGSGFTLTQIELNERTIIGTSLNKAFAASGGVFLFKDKVLREKIKYCGALHTFSGPIQPPMLGAIVASSRIHLSDEIYQLQESLKAKIRFANEEIKKTSLPLVEVNDAPIFFIGAGAPKVCFNLARRIMNDGYFVSVGSFPAVSVKNTGIRFALNNHLSLEDIKGLVASVARNFPEAVAEEGKTVQEVFNLFDLKQNHIEKGEKRKKHNTYRVTVSNTIASVERELWDEKVSPGAILDYDDFFRIERQFSGDNSDPDFWRFNYITIYDQDNKPVLLTLLTSALFKEDMLSPAGVSRKVEAERMLNPGYLVSRVLVIGTLITEGKYMYLDMERNDWKDILKVFLDTVSEIQEKENVNSVMLRDFNPEKDKEIIDALFDEGFVKINLPDSYRLKFGEIKTSEAYLAGLSKRNRRHIKQEILIHQDKYEVEVKNTVDEKELRRVYNLYSNVNRKGFEINMFPLKYAFFEEINESGSWEFIMLYTKKEYSPDGHRNLIGVAVVKKKKPVYIPAVIGLDYKYLHSHGNYRQCLYRVVMRAMELGYAEVHMEMGAGIEKRKFGCEEISNLVMVQTKDNFNQEMLFNIKLENKV